MSQQWVTVLGLVLDFMGFGLLLREWWLAVFSETTQIAAEESLERQRAMRHFARSHRDPNERNPYETLERMQDEAAIRSARGAQRAAISARKRVFLTASVLIFAGFVLQIVGAIPGCCPPWIPPQT